MRVNAPHKFIFMGCQPGFFPFFSRILLKNLWEIVFFGTFLVKVLAIYAGNW